MSRATETIHSLALVGSAGVGKTSLAEALLVDAGALSSRGSVDKKSTVMDHDSQAQEQQHSLSSSVACFESEGCHIQLLDTPGYPDFIGHTLAALDAVETMVIVVSAVTGLDSMTRRLLKIGAERRLSRFIVVNKIDAEGADLAGLLASLQAEFGRECLSINLPTPARDEVLDCFSGGEGESALGSVAEAHRHLIDQVVEVDEALMTTYLEQGEVFAPSQLHGAFEQALREGHLLPVAFVSARTGAGVAAFRRLLTERLPTPLEANPRALTSGGPERRQRVYADANPTKALIAHVFKIAFDAFIGRQAFLRIHQGTLRREQKLLLGDARKAFKVSHVYKPFGKELREVDSAVAGEIAVLVKTEELHRDALVYEDHAHDTLAFEAQGRPTPLYGLAISARAKGDEQKLAEVLHKLAEEDPCLLVEHNGVTRETVLKGLGELHLRLTLERMASRHKLAIDSHPPRIAYRETLSAPAEGHYRHKKQSGGAGQFGEVHLRVEPLARGQGFEFVDAVVGGAIPGQFMGAVEKGIREALAHGVVAGYPVEDVRVTVLDGKHHSVDSKEIAFATAARKAFIEAASHAKPQVLEPIVDLDIAAPATVMGDITGDLAGRRARILGTDSEGARLMVVHAQAPLAELDGYASRLKAQTAGEGSFSLALSHYEAVPLAVQQELARHFSLKEDD